MVLGLAAAIFEGGVVEQSALVGPMFYVVDCFVSERERERARETTMEERGEAFSASSLPRLLRLLLQLGVIFGECESTLRYDCFARLPFVRWTTVQARVNNPVNQDNWLE